MRTSIILLGLLISTAIIRSVEAAYAVKVSSVSDQVAMFVALVFVACAIMDVVEFFKNATSNK